MEQIIDFLKIPQVGMAIFILVLVALFLNFLTKIYLIKAGIYKRVHKQKRIDWEKLKAGVFLVGFGGLFVASFKYGWGFGGTILAIIIFIGATQILSSLFLSRRSWKSYKYWD